MLIVLPGAGEVGERVERQHHCRDYYEDDGDDGHGLERRKREVELQSLNLVFSFPMPFVNLAYKEILMKCAVRSPPFVLSSIQFSAFQCPL